ncbi:Uncharacterized protein FWK35_00005903 [Aphis craccivora]|uniref:Uncharacterized protein n=1 Tax=Aphis craccivora TaxID=307492 RepID=A0A6G0ZL22_APHCR|nr:Uncharacterized protein FWK35_00005903 [Aphis craccivora]
MWLMFLDNIRGSKNCVFENKTCETLFAGKYDAVEFLINILSACFYPEFGKTPLKFNSKTIAVVVVVTHYGGGGGGVADSAALLPSSLSPPLERATVFIGNGFYGICVAVGSLDKTVNGFLATHHRNRSQLPVESVCVMREHRETLLQPPKSNDHYIIYPATPSAARSNRF